MLDDLSATATGASSSLVVSEINVVVDPPPPRSEPLFERTRFLPEPPGAGIGPAAIASLYTAITGGVQFRIHKSMIVRPEPRYDNNALQRPYEGKHSRFTAASDLIIRC
jgi:hypothetical protein